MIYKVKRKYPGANIKFCEAEAMSIDFEKKQVRARDSSDIAADGLESFDIPYDHLALGVGATTNTFGTPGAMDHCLFLKSIPDARKIRSTIMDCFETASLPGLSDSEIDRLLTTVVVGAGPTGVEMAAELRDFIKDDLLTIYPHFASRDVKVQVVEMSDKMLGTYDKLISQYCAERFYKQDIAMLTKHQVKEVKAKSIEVLDLEKNEMKSLPFGTCIWASGVRPVDLAMTLAKDFQGTRMLETDDCLRVRGSHGTIFAMGDCAKVTMPSMKVQAKKLFENADKNKDGVLQREELMPLIEFARKEFPQMEAYLGNVNAELTNSIEPVTFEFFDKCLVDVDRNMKMLPPTAQVAAQQGRYLAKVFGGVPTSELGNEQGFEPKFEYDHQGSMAYVGGERAVIDSPFFGVSSGFITMLLWRGAYWAKCVSFRCQVLMAFDWVKVQVLGRDTTRL